MNETEGRITRPELNAMAKERGMKGYLKLKRFELAERLGIELPKPKTEREKEAEKGTPGRSRQSGRNDDGVSEHQQGGTTGVGEIRNANLSQGNEKGVTTGKDEVL